MDAVQRTDHDCVCSTGMDLSTVDREERSVSSEETMFNFRNTDV